MTLTTLNKRPPRPKKCPVCKTVYVRRRAVQPTCGAYKCEETFALRKAKKRIAREAYLADLEKRAKAGLTKRRNELLAEAQATFNAFIRERDRHLPCVSCNRPPSWTGQWHASHYRSVGAHPEFRFDEKNVHRACSVCNNFLSGRLVEYRAELINRVGIDEVERLEGNAPPLKLSGAELIEIKKSYAKKARELRRARLQQELGLCD